MNEEYVDAPCILFVHQMTPNLKIQKIIDDHQSDGGNAYGS